MKKYKVIKELKVGDTLEIDGMPTLADSGFLEEVELKYIYVDTGREIEKGNTFYSINDGGSVVVGWWGNLKSEKGLYEQGVYKFRENAEKESEYREARATLKRFMLEKKVVNTWGDHNIIKWVVCYNYRNDRLEASSWVSSKYMDIYFNNETDAQECINLYERELKIYLGVI